MSKLVLYGMEISPSVRSCLLTLKALNVPYEYKILNLFAGEHLTEEFLEHNPQHTVPILDDNGTWLWDSHAINAYLVTKYGKDDSLYPKDPAQRAVVDQRMYFDASVLYRALGDIVLPIYMEKTTEVPKEVIDNVYKGYDFIEKFLSNNSYIAGKNLTIADFCCVANVSSLNGLASVDKARYPKTSAWLERMSTLPYYDANGKGNTEYIAFLKTKITKIHY